MSGGRPPPRSCADRRQGLNLAAKDAALSWHGGRAPRPPLPVPISVNITTRILAGIDAFPQSAASVWKAVRSPGG